MRFDNKDLGLFSNEAPKKKKRRIKITEEQYNRLFNIMEQIELRNVVEPSDETGNYEREQYQSVKQKEMSRDMVKKLLKEKPITTISNDTSDDSIDFIIDVASAALDVIPGIGNGASFVVDVLHSISYFIRSNNTNDEVEKVEKFIGGFITATFAFIPYGGNAASIVAKQGVKSFIKMVMTTGRQHAIKLGINKGVYLLKWKFSFLLFLYKLFGDQLRDILSESADKLVKIKTAIKNALTGDWIGDPLDVKPKLKFIDDLVKTIKGTIPYIDDIRKVYDSLNSEGLINEEDEGGESTSSSSSGSGGSVWTSGASSYPNLNRGKANPIGNSVWNSGVNRGPANPL